MFSLDYKFLLDFVKSVEKVIVKPDYITFSRSNNVITLCCSGESSSVVGSCNSTVESFNFRLEANTIINLVKKLYEGSVEFSVDKSHVKISKDNIKVKLSRSGHGSIFKYDLGTKFLGSVEDLYQVFCNIFSSCGINKKFGGILIDHSMVCSFDDSSMFLDLIDGFNGRFVVSSDVARLVKSFKSNELDSFYSGRFFVVRLTSGIDVIFSQVQDKYPKGFANQLKLDEISLEKCFVFDLGSFSSVIDLVSSVSGSSENYVRFEIIGEVSDGVGWRVSCRNFKNTHVEELVESTGQINRPVSFKVNKKILKKYLQGLQDYANVYLSEGFCCFYQELGDFREYRFLSIAR